MELKTLYKRNSDPGLFRENENGTNCGSFALNVTEWYTPYIEGYIEDDSLWKYEVDERARWAYDLLQDGYTAMEVMDCVTDRDFEFILMTCPWLEPIDLDEMRDTDRVIAYRLSMEVPGDVSEFDMDENGDFHFRLFENGEWWEKNGAGPVHKVIDMSEEPWEVDDWLIYDGPVKYARFKEGENVSIV